MKSLLPFLRNYKPKGGNRSVNKKEETNDIYACNYPNLRGVS